MWGLPEKQPGGRESPPSLREWCGFPVQVPRVVVPWHPVAEARPLPNGPSCYYRHCLDPPNFPAPPPAACPLPHLLWPQSEVSSRPLDEVSAGLNRQLLCVPLVLAPRLHTLVLLIAMNHGTKCSFA